MIKIQYMTIKKILLTITACAIATISYAQKDMDKAYDRMAQSVCECANAKGINLDEASQSEIEMTFGLCLLKAYNADAKFFKSKGINLTAEGNAMEQLGEAVGIKMAEHCPDMLMSMASFYMDDDENIDGSGESTSITGTIEKVEDGIFSTIHIKSEEGRTYKLLWITYVDNHDLFLEALKNKNKYTFYYYETEMYDNRINEYRDMLILDGITQD